MSWQSFGHRLRWTVFHLTSYFFSTGQCANKKTISCKWLINIPSQTKKKERKRAENVCSSTNLCGKSGRSNQNNSKSVILNILCDGYLLTFVESSSNLVCSAINRTQKQLRCISGGHFECEKAGLLIIGLLMPPEALSISGIFDKSSDSDWGIGMEPWIWQLPNGPDLLKLLRCRFSQLLLFRPFLCHFTQTATPSASQSSAAALNVPFKLWIA